MRRSRGKGVSTTTSSMRSTRRWMKSPSVRDGAGQAEARVQVGPAEVGVDEDDALAEPRELPADGGGEHGLADAALASADRPDLTPLRSRQREGERPAHRKVTLPSTASSRTRVGADFFHSGRGANVIAQRETPSPTMVTFRCRHCVAPRIGLS